MATYRHVGIHVLTAFMACLQGHDPHVATARASHTETHRQKGKEKGRERVDGEKGCPAEYRGTSHIRPVQRCARPLFMAPAFGLPFDFAAEIETGTGTETVTTTPCPLLLLLHLLLVHPSARLAVYLAVSLSVCPSVCLSGC